MQEEFPIMLEDETVSGEEKVMIHIKRIFILILMAVLTLVPAAYCIYLPYSYSGGEKIIPCYIYGDLSELTENGMIYLKILGIVYALVTIITLILYLIYIIYRNKKIEISLKITNLILIITAAVQYIYTVSKSKDHYGELEIPGSSDWVYKDEIFLLELILAVIVFGI